MKLRDQIVAAHDFHESLSSYARGALAALLGIGGLVFYGMGLMATLPPSGGGSRTPGALLVCLIVPIMGIGLGMIIVKSWFARLPLIAEGVVIIALTARLLDQGAVWSAEAVLLPYNGGQRRLVIPSTDRSKRAFADDTDLTVVISDKLAEGVIGVPVLAELSWSPDGNALAVTGSDGGNVGPWYVALYRIENLTLHQLQVDKSVREDFDRRYTCAIPRVPNIALLKWIGSVEVLLVAEVPFHSSCPEMGLRRGYVVSLVTGRILRQYDQDELNREWRGALGRRFS